MEFNTIIQVWSAVAVFAFIYLLFKPAPYGRYAETGWGPMISSKTGWLFMEVPVLIIMIVYFVIYFSDLQPAPIVGMSLFMLHYSHRCFIYPFRLKVKNRQMPLLIALSAIFFNLINGNILGYYFTQQTNAELKFDTWMIIGIVLFFIGMFINIKADNILMGLRKNGNGYSIPKGWLYDFISCPNYFGELLEWLGFALAVGHLAAWSFFIWSFANLVPRALAHHRWYKNKFPEYPKDRKALVPFVW